MFRVVVVVEQKKVRIRMYSNTASQLRVPMIELVSQFGDDIVDIVVGGSEAKERSCLRCTKAASMKATTFKSVNPTRRLYEHTKK